MSIFLFYNVSDSVHFLTSFCPYFSCIYRSSEIYSEQRRLKANIRLSILLELEEWNGTENHVLCVTSSSPYLFSNSRMRNSEWHTLHLQFLENRLPRALSPTAKNPKSKNRARKSCGFDHRGGQATVSVVHPDSRFPSLRMKSVSLT